MIQLSLKLEETESIKWAQNFRFRFQELLILVTTSALKFKVCFNTTFFLVNCIIINLGYSIAIELMLEAWAAS